MNKISDALAEILSPHNPLYYPFRAGLINLSELARFLRPLLEARTKKPVGHSATVMALSRLYKESKSLSEKIKPLSFKIQNLTIHAELVVMSVQKNDRINKAIHALTARLHKLDSYLTVTEGITEITMICSKAHIKEAKEALSGATIRTIKDVASLSIKFPPQYTETPGFLAQILQVLSFQEINVIELASTSTELMVYLDVKDVNLASRTLYETFMIEGKERGF